MDRILADRYRLTEQIGMGGMAIVYRAIDLRTGHNVAVKVLRPEFNEDAEFIGRFQREAEAASKMTHHNIVNLLDVGMDGDSRYLVMEYVQGKTLKEVIQERGRLSAPLACQITIRILSALEHAHRNGIVHRDIKPQNILVHSAAPSVRSAAGFSEADCGAASPSEPDSGTEASPEKESSTRTRVILSRPP